MSPSKDKKIKKLTGLAVRDAKEKTVLVEVTFVKIHPIYKKRYFRSRKYLVQADMEVKKDQKVIIQEGKPVSRRKSWQVIKVIDFEAEK